MCALTACEGRGCHLWSMLYAVACHALHEARSSCGLVGSCGVALAEPSTCAGLPIAHRGRGLFLRACGFDQGASEVSSRCGCGPEQILPAESARGARWCESRGPALDPGWKPVSRDRAPPCGIKNGSALAKST